MTKTARPVIKNAQDYNKTAQNITALTPGYCLVVFPDIRFNDDGKTGNL